MYPLYATVDWRVEYGVISFLRGHSSFFDGRRDVDVLSDIRRLRECMILGVRGRKGGGTAESP